MMTIISEIFYAVQVGDDYAWDFGDNNMDSAVALAKILAEDSKNDGLEIRIAIIDVAENFCDSVMVIREGTSF